MRYQRLHFIGIGGSGMAPIAKLAKELGFVVTGSDVKESANVAILKAKGIPVDIGHHGVDFSSIDAVVVSTAIPVDNPELKIAKLQSKPILKRAEMLNLLMERFPVRISVAGTHGKTTTSSMICSVLSQMDKKPSFVVGSPIAHLQADHFLGTSDFFVAESDESDGSFLMLTPNRIVVTNIEEDHMDFFKDFKEISSYFHQFLMKASSQKESLFILNADDAYSRSLLDSFSSVLSFGIDHPADYRAKEIEVGSGSLSFLVYEKNDCLGKVSLSVYGRHNVSNALAAIALCRAEGLSFSMIQKGLALFQGTKRRFQKIGQVNGAFIYDDYGHHPTEIKATLSGIKSWFKGRLICIFQPHRYSRTSYFLNDFSMAFSDADWVILTDIYAAHEPEISGISSKVLQTLMNQHHGHVDYFSQYGDIPSFLKPKLKEGDIVLTLGAGDVDKVAQALVSSF